MREHLLSGTEAKNQIRFGQIVRAMDNIALACLLKPFQLY